MLTFSYDMLKMHGFCSNFSKITKRWRLSAPASLLICDLGDLKLHDLSNL